MDGLRRKLPSPGVLFVFEAAARHENFTRAAEELNVTQPAVSRALAGLERYLGTRLFQRGKPGARLTEDGKLLKNAVIEGFSGIEAALDRLAERQTGKATITLSVSTAFTTHWLMPRISRFQQAFPNVDLRFQLIAGPVAGPMGGVDIAMRYAAPGDREGRYVMHEAYAPVCAPDYLAGLSGEGAALIRLDGERSTGLREHVARAAPVAPTQLSFSDYSVVLQAALVGQGIAAGWLNIVAHWLSEGQLVPALPVLVRPGRVCRLLTRTGGEHDETVAAVADWLLQAMQDDMSAIAARHPALDLGGILQEDPA
ncbi:LysR substrate-binding domain-containing protein [Salipiger mucosus]|uniref:Glycine cleavage system transcriptional activator n=1 Tax=Salipiger mucosus DSM 16094 TaxID=1123237 RepID=S9RNY1_9RHOB|nr:LysR substrate-binding domain-containing protein [Salipiger mucosus]EPX79795.1 Glycine cleavage system transcriptional activator [Salipiger mucosus DSM 16094]